MARIEPDGTIVLEVEDSELIDLFISARLANEKRKREQATDGGAELLDVTNEPMP